jgi:tRNA/rRNA methyltransferase
MPMFEVVLVEPKFGGNIGAVARVMMNFDVSSLVVVSPQVSLDGDACRDRAVHAQKILDSARVVQSFQEGITGSDFVVGTSSIVSASDRRHLRKSMSLLDFPGKIYDVSGCVSLVFGREDYGLLNQEIEQCDILLQIPTSPRYPSLNLSHAVGVVLYSLFQPQKTRKPVRRVGSVEKDILYHYVSLLLDTISYPDYKKEKTVMLIKRILGRAMVSQLEYHTLMGVLRGTVEKLQHGQGNTNNP